ncbi:MAG: Rieske 2Fe-2S domain-containing protein [Nostoc sp.]|uniref:aromatic ring-hydroxylating oxygenase subunit alpha n=1 Tax=Nostoc sp. TaxID=1180 RepID=UPI002FF893F1
MVSQVIHSSVAYTKNLGLGGYYYSNPDVFALEMETIWRNTWHFVGWEKNLPSPGNYLTCRIGEEPIFVIRQLDGKLQAMHNVCPHRGARLLEGQDNCRFIRCPYHFWNFNLEGKLTEITQPQLFPELDKSTIHLLKGRVETWGGLIFVSPSPEGESLTDFLAGMPEHFQEYNQPGKELIEVTRYSYDQPINWKILVENYLDFSHIPFVHPQTLVKEWGVDIQNHLDVTQTDRNCQLEFRFKNKPEETRSDFYIFPNLAIVVDVSQVEIWQFIPINYERTKIEVFMCQTSTQAELFPLETNLQADYDQFMEEDFVVCRKVQESVKSRAYNATQLSNINGHQTSKSQQVIANFHKNVMEAISVKNE